MLFQLLMRACHFVDEPREDDIVLPDIDAASFDGSEIDNEYYPLPVGATWSYEADGPDGFETIEALRKCLERLSPSHRGALDLFYRHEKSRAELAAHLAMTEDGVKALLRRIREGLADCIRRRLASPGMGAS